MFNAKDIVVHGVMRFECDNCKAGFPVYVEKGIENFPDTIFCPFCKELAVDTIGFHTMSGGYEVPLLAGRYCFVNVGGKGKVRFYKDGELVNPYK